MKRGIAIIVLLLGIALLLQGCGRKSGGGSSNGIEIRGSDTMVNLGQAWAEAYGQKHPDANISVSGGGSGTGIAALINGDADISESSREMKPEELDQAKSKGMDPKEFVVARDGLSVIINKANPVRRLTIPQLSDIYTRKLTNWKQVGGKDQNIVVLSRDKSSGTYDFFLEHVVRKGDAKGPENYDKGVLLLVSSSTIAKEIANNEATIGYVGMGYVDPREHNTIAVAQNTGSPYVEPTVDNVLNGTYPVARPLYFYTPGEPEGTVKNFIDFVLSDEGQKIVERLEFVPVREIP